MADTIQNNGSIIIEDTPDSHGGTIRNITATSVVRLKEKNITINGVYKATNENADGYSQVNVNIPGTVLSGSLSASYSNGQISPLYTLKGEVTVPLYLEHEKFVDEYEYTPTWTDQDIPTKDKLLTSDILINSIPLYEVSNESGGYTLII